MSGCSINDCASIQVKQSDTEEWVTAYDENNDCGIQMGDNPFTSTDIAVDFRITSTTGHVVEASSVVLGTTANTEWDFGSNFDSCQAVVGTNDPTTTTTASPTQFPSNNPTQSPIELICEENCSHDDNDVYVVVNIFFSPSVNYILSDIHCWLYQLFSSWFANIASINSFDACDVEVNVYGGNAVSQRRLLDNAIGSGNMSVSISGDDDEIVNGLDVNSMTNDLKNEFMQTFDIQMDMIGIELLEGNGAFATTKERLAANEDKGENMEIYIVIVVVVLVLLIVVGASVLLCKWKMNQKDAKDEVNAETTEMITGSKHQSIVSQSMEMDGGYPTKAYKIGTTDE